MTSIWVESLSRIFENSFDLLEAAIRDCTDDLWVSSMWQLTESDWRPSDGSERAYAARRSTPWSVAWHALEVVDYDITGDFTPFSAPPPFTDKAHWRDLALLPRAWTQTELLGYIDELRRRVNDVLSAMTDEKASTLLPSSHRHHGQRYAWLLTSIPLHTVEHAAQIRQFITTAM
jgi:hypothetical protein